MRTLRAGSLSAEFGAAASYTRFGNVEVLGAMALRGGGRQRPLPLQSMGGIAIRLRSFGPSP